MIKLLIKKNIMEIFRGYFYDSKKNRARSKTSIVLFIALFVFLMVGVIGGMFAVLSVLMSPLIEIKLGWLYYVLMSVLSLSLGIFGSVFTTYSCLYIAKDNDLLLSMPLPVKDIILSRILSVYLMGLMYSASVILPAVIVYFIKGPVTIHSILGAFSLILLISLLVLISSCGLGWIVAKAVKKIKNKSLLTVVLSLAFLILYYSTILKIQTFLREFIENAAQYGIFIKGKIYPLYLLGRVGEGDYFAILIGIVVIAVLFAGMWFLIQRNYINMVIETGAAKRKAYKKAVHHQKSLSRTLFEKELGRFLSSPNYMLNCSLGTVFMPIMGIGLLFKGKELREMLPMLGIDQNVLALFMAGILCMAASMNDITAPSISLEGKNIWILQSLPVNPWNILKAKLKLQLLLTEIPLIFCSMCAVAALKLNVSILSLVCIFIHPILFSVLSAEFGLFTNLKNPNLKWTNEIAPIKQSLNVILAMFGGWGYTVVFVAGGWLLRNQVLTEIYMLIGMLLTGCFMVLLYRWLKKYGTEIFINL